MALALYFHSSKGFGYVLAHSISFSLVHDIALSDSSSHLINGHFVDESFLTLLKVKEN